MDSQPDCADETLVTEVLGGDSDRYSELIDRYFGAVRSVAVARQNNPSEVDDIVQETFLRGFEKLVRLRDPRRFGPWILSIARNLCKDRSRRAHREVPLDAELDLVAAPALPSIEQREIIEFLQHNIRQLAPEQREVLLLRYFGKKSLTETAQLLGISYSAAAKRLQRAREALGATMLTYLEGAQAPKPSREQIVRLMAVVAASALALRSSAASGSMIAFPFAAKIGTAVFAIAALVTVAGLWTALPAEPAVPRSADSVILTFTPPDPVASSAGGFTSRPNTPAPQEIAQTDNDRAETVAVNGRVFDERNNSGLANLVVRFMGPDDIEVMYQGKPTDERGQYAIDGLQPGRYQVSLAERRSNGTTVLSGNWQTTQKVQVLGAPEIQTIDIPFSKGTFISGHVVDSKENGVEGAEIDIDTRSTKGRLSWSNADGYFEIQGLEPSEDTWIRANTPAMASKPAGPFFVFNDADWDYSKYDFANWADDTHLAATILNATSPNLDGLKSRGGKLIIWHGWADAALPAGRTIDYYETLLAHDPQAMDYARLFMVPGCYHCGGGPGVSNVDWLEVVSQWVEKGIAPDRIIARRPATGDAPEMTRPLYPYPQRAKYDGDGAPSDETNFVVVGN